MSATGWAVVLLVVLAVTVVAVVGATWWFLRARYRPLRRRHRELSELHRFASVLDRSPSVDDLVDAAFEEIGPLLGATAVGLVVYDSAGRALVTRASTSSLALPDRTDDPSWRAALASLEPVEIDASTVGRSADRRASWMAVAVADRDAVLGLVVAGWDPRVGPEERRRRLRGVALPLVARLRHAVFRAEVETLARHDPVTGLPGRDELLDHVARSAAERSADEVSGMIVLDLDRFTDVNESLGHAAGDELLATTGTRLADELDERDLLARLASDEFAVSLRRCSLDEIVTLAHHVARDLGSVRVGDVDVLVTGSVGVAHVEPGGEVDPAALLRRATVAGRSAKGRRDPVTVYADRFDRRGTSRLSMLGELREALDRGAIHVEFQPKLALATGHVAGVEALARWDHPMQGRASTQDLIRVSEDAGLIRAVTDLVLDRALAAAGRWRRAGVELPVAVNVSVRDVGPDLVERVRRRLESHDVPPEALVIEITESEVLAASPEVSAAIDLLAELGVGLALDDYGTGYSSLGQLRRLPVRELKIDRSFVADMLDDDQDAVIVRSTIELAHDLGLVVTAEGVESSAVLSALTELGCDLGQGFAISRALSEPVLRAWLTRRTAPGEPTQTG